MKYLLIGTLTTALFSLFGCSSMPSSDEILNNAALRNEVMTTIATNPEMTSQMMNHLMANEQGMSMMRRDSMRMSGMMGENGQPGHEGMMEMMNQMMTMTESDTAMCRQMTNMMLGHTSMMNMMMESMHENGIMDEESMMRGKEMMNHMNH